MGGAWRGRCSAPIFLKTTRAPCGIVPPPFPGPVLPGVTPAALGPGSPPPAGTPGCVCRLCGMPPGTCCAPSSVCLRPDAPALQDCEVHFTQSLIHDNPSHKRVNRSDIAMTLTSLDYRCACGARPAAGGPARRGDRGRPAARDRRGGFWWTKCVRCLLFSLENVDLQPPSVTLQPPSVTPQPPSVTPQTTINYPPNHHQLPPNRRRLPSNHCQFSPNRRQLPTNRRQLPPNRRQLSTNRRQLPPNHHQLAPNPGRVPPQPPSVTPPYRRWLPSTCCPVVCLDDELAVRRLHCFVSFRSPEVLLTVNRRQLAANRRRCTPQLSWRRRLRKSLVRELGADQCRAAWNARLVRVCPSPLLCGRRLVYTRLFIA